MSLGDQLGAIAYDIYDATASLFSRQRSELRRQTYQAAHFEAAARNRTMEDMSEAAFSADDELEMGDREKVRDRALALYQNAPVAKSLIDLRGDQIVGTGIVPMIDVDPDRVGITEAQASKFASLAEEIFEEWAEHADAARRMNFAQLQRMVCDHRFLAGEIFSAPVIRRARYNSDKVIERRVELIEAHRVEQPPGRIERDGMRSGIQLGRLGEPISYSVRKARSLGQFSVSPGDYMTLPAVTRGGLPGMMHHYVQKRPGQTRGYSELAPVIPTIHHRQRYQQAEVIAQRLVSCIGFVFKQPTVAKGLLRGKDGNVSIKMKPGMNAVVPPGYDVEPFAPNRTADHIAPMIETLDRTAAFGSGMTYGAMTRNFSKDNFSNTRAALILDRRTYVCEVSRDVYTFSQPYLSLVLYEAFLKGWFPDWVQASGYRDFTHRWVTGEWIPTPGNDWIDPVKDVEATERELAMGTESLSRVARRRKGRRFEQILRERKRDQMLMEKHGVQLEMAGVNQQQDDAAIPPGLDDDGDDE